MTDYDNGGLKEGDDMLALKKDTIKKDTNIKHAKDSEVLQAIMESNKKHSKMMTMLAK